MRRNSFKIFYLFLFFTTILSYLPFIIPSFPVQILGFNITGYAWVIMLLVTLPYLPQIKNFFFPLRYWIPWIIYICGYLILEFSFLGLQLSLQYILPIFIGVVASTFRYKEDDLKWLFKWLTVVCCVAIIDFLKGFIFYKSSYVGNASTPMLISIVISILVSLWYLSRERKYFLSYLGLLLIPIISVTRMGIAVFIVIYILHFANYGVLKKVYPFFLGLIMALLIFNSKGFQQKMFYSGNGNLSDVTLDYYNNPELRNNGRSTWKELLLPGLEKSPIWGNGPRSDNYQLVKVTKLRGGEAHNDYLSVRYNYGYVGLILLLFGFAGSFLALYRTSKYYVNHLIIRILSTSALTLFAAFLLFMYSDNILKYTIYFPNYFFCLIGIVFSVKNDVDLSTYIQTNVSSSEFLNKI